MAIVTTHESINNHSAGFLTAIKTRLKAFATKLKPVSNEHMAVGDIMTFQPRSAR